MKGLFLALIPMGCFLVGWLAGRVKKLPTDLDMRELVRLRKMHTKLNMKAAEHAVLGDDFAVIALGILNPEETPDGR